MLTRQRLLDWLVSVENDADHPERYGALRDAQSLAMLAARDGLISDDPQGHGEFARVLAQLKSNGQVDWDWQRWPSGTRDAEEPGPTMLSAEHLHRCGEVRVRVLPPSATASPPPRPAAEPAISLEPEQEQLLVEMVEAARDAPRHEQEFHLITFDQGDVLIGPGGQRPVLGRDVHALHKAGLLDPTQQNYIYGNKYVVSAAGRGHYKELHQRAAEPFEQIDERIRSYLEAPEFRAAYPAAYARWNAAADLLWQDDASEHLTTIGHKAREAMQDFATALVNRYHPFDTLTDPTRTKDRVSAVLRMHHGGLGDGRTKMLDALFSYWSAAVDLVQRQTHGGHKEGEPLTWEDARRVVFQTANVMVELHRAIEAAANSSAATGDVSSATT